MLETRELNGRRFVLMRVSALPQSYLTKINISRVFRTVIQRVIVVPTEQKHILFQSDWTWKSYKMFLVKD